MTGDLRSGAGEDNERLYLDVSGTALNSEEGVSTSVAPEADSSEGASLPSIGVDVGEAGSGIE